MTQFQKFEIWLGRTFLVLISITVTFIAAEWAARRWWPRSTNHYANQLGDLAHYPRPYVMFSAKPNSPPHNRLGYLFDLPKMPKPINEFRILMFGGSTVYGPPNGIGTALPQRLEDRLAPEVDGLRIYNFGVPSSISRQDLFRFMVDGIGFQPDMVIFYGGGNDLLRPRDIRPNYPHRFIFYELNPAMTDKIEDYNLWLSLAMGSQILRNLFGTKFYESVYTSPYLDSSAPDQYADLRLKAYIQNIRMAAHFARSFQIHFVPILQPVLDLKQTLANEEKSWTNDLGREVTNRLYAAARQELRAERLIDVSDFFKDFPGPAFSDRIHLPSETENLLADRLANILRPVVQGARGTPAPRHFVVPETDFAIEAQ